MAVMMGPDGRALPVVTGAAAMAMSGGDRGESITSDTGNRPAAPREPKGAAPTPTAPPRASLTEPKDEEEHVAAAPPPAQQPTVQVDTPAGYASDEEIDALHVRFDQMELELKRRLAVATLHARFDALTAWLAERFPG
jgi:hypothetical protein